jgi:RNA polymerase sigma-70 factor (ECF subfamily)
MLDKIPGENRQTSRRPGSFEREALVHLEELKAIAMRYTRNERDADDLVQETLLRAFVAWDRFQSGTNCRAWLFRILTNNFINEYRRIAKERRLNDEARGLFCPTRRRAAADPEGVMMERLIGDEVSAALAALPHDYRKVVELADLQGLSYREVANRLGCPMGTVMSRLHRARRQLERALGSYARERGIVRSRKATKPSKRVAAALADTAFQAA